MRWERSQAAGDWVASCLAIGCLYDGQLNRKPENAFDLIWWLMALLLLLLLFLLRFTASVVLPARPTERPIRCEREAVDAINVAWSTRVFKYEIMAGTFVCPHF